MIIDGRSIAKKIEMQVKKDIDQLNGDVPSLAFVRVGEDPASIAYLKRKKRKCFEVGIRSVDHELDETTSEKFLLQLINQLNCDEAIDGILVQLPLPSHFYAQRVFEAIDPNKDVDGFHPLNLGKLLVGENSGFFSCTPYGIFKLMEEVGIDPSGKHVVIIGRSNIVGKPLASLLLQKRQGANATVTVTHSGTQNLKAHTLLADILISAMGRAHFIKKDMVKPGAIVIDVGISRFQGKLTGDVDFEEVKKIAQHITPVPGGVGPMTIAMLLYNTLLAHKRRHR